MSGMKEIALTARYYEAETDRNGLALPRGNNVVAILIDENEIILPESEAREFGAWLMNVATEGERYGVSELYWGSE
jgi:hypothetical protein